LKPRSLRRSEFGFARRPFLSKGVLRRTPFETPLAPPK